MIMMKQDRLDGIASTKASEAATASKAVTELHIRIMPNHGDGRAAY